MRRVPSGNAFARAARQAYRQQEPYGRCPICQEEIFWPEEQIECDNHGRICHAECVEKEE